VGISRERIIYVLHDKLSLQKKERTTICDVMLHHDNAAPHKATIVTEYLHSERVELLPHLPDISARSEIKVSLGVSTMR